MDSSITERAQGGPGERLRQARVLSPDKALRRVGAAAKALGVSALSLQRYEEGERRVPLEVLQRAAAVFHVPLHQLIDAVAPQEVPALAPQHELRALISTERLTAGETAFVLGEREETVLAWLDGTRPIPPKNLRAAREAIPHARTDGALESYRGPAIAGGRIFATDAEKISYAIGVLDMANAAKADLARCLDAAMSALTAPLTSPTPTSGGELVAEKLERHRAARSAPSEAAAAPAAAASRAKGRRSAQ
jgi:transcriptional regulator with XRE-family HTH domain